jgi:hypothetical protein
MGPRAIAVAALAATVLPVAVRCGHEPLRCEPVRRPTQRVALPSEAETVLAVERAGFRYEPCENLSRYRLVRPGTRVLTQDEMLAIGRHLLDATPGSSGTGIGVCACGATPDPPPPCLSFSLRAGAMDPPALAALLSSRVEALSLGTAALSVRVDLHAKPSPRCLPEDPGCGPIPVGHQCLADVRYLPGRPRTPVFERLNGGDCAHDGECDSGECDSCFSTRESDRYISGDCFFPSGMKPNALCGCVAGQCTFFVQAP